jgi:hypothetical protein
MNWRSVVSLMVAASAVSFTAGRVFSQDTGPAGPSPEEKQKLCEEMAKPVDQHKKLAQAAGDWESETTTWMQGPEGAPTKSKASYSAKSVLNGLWLMSQHKGEMNGKPFEGIAFTGYSKERQKHVVVWFDSMSSTPMVLWGTADPSGKVITFEGEPMTMMGQTFTPRWIERYDDADRATFEMWSKYEGAGDYIKEMEMKSTRRK